SRADTSSPCFHERPSRARMALKYCEGKHVRAADRCGRHRIGPIGELEATMKTLSHLEALLDLANDSQTRDLSRRTLLARAAALGAMALSSAAPADAEITSPAIYAKAGSYGGNTLPVGVRPRLV